MRKLMKSAAVAASSVCSLSVWAAPFTATLPDQVSIGTNFYIGNVTSPGTTAPGAARLTFELIGYGGIDGFGPRISNADVFDSFDFRVNDPTIDGVSFGAILNLGGSNPGTPTLYDINPSLNPLNASLVFYQDNVANQGGIARFSVDFTLLQGLNDLAFNFGLNRSVGESWGLRNIVVTADFPTSQPPGNAVPEPQTHALIFMGLAAAGWFSRRSARRGRTASR
jgi:PEP-CTERM motif